MQDVLTLLQEAAPEVHVLADRDLRGLGVGAGKHAREQVLGGVRLAKVVLAGLAAELVVEEEVLDVVPLEELLGHVGGRAAA